MRKDLQGLHRRNKKVKSYYCLLLALCFLVALSGWLVLYFLILSQGGYLYEDNAIIVWTEMVLSFLLLLFSTTMFSWFTYSNKYKGS